MFVRITVNDGTPNTGKTFFGIKHRPGDWYRPIKNHININRPLTDDELIKKYGITKEKLDAKGFGPNGEKDVLWWIKEIGGDIFEDEIITDGGDSGPGQVFCFMGRSAQLFNPSQYKDLVEINLSPNRKDI